MALFRATALPEVPPFRAFPCRRSRTPLGATCSLVVIHRPRRANLPRPYQRWFLLTPTPKRGSQIPPTPMGSLSPHQKGTSPGPPGLERSNRPLRSAASTSKLYSLRQSVPPVQVSLNLEAEALLGFFTLWSFPHPRFRSSTQPAKAGSNLARGLGQDLKDLTTLQAR